MCVLLFFFKQKTAYEMRMSDWSSDVCSSDLLVVARLAGLAQLRHLRGETRSIIGVCQRGELAGLGRQRLALEYELVRLLPGLGLRARLALGFRTRTDREPILQPWRHFVVLVGGRRDLRSEEHTSELQSLMRIS